MRFATAALAALLSTQAYAAQPDEYANIHTLGIVSTVGGVLVVKRAGITVFGNSETKVPIGWGLDNLLTKDMTAALAGKYTVRPVSFDPDRLRQCWDWEKCVSFLPADPAIDAYLFVQEAGIYVRGGNLDPHGIGIYRDERPFMADGNLLHVLYRVDVVNAKTGHRIDYGTGRLSTTAAFGDHPYPTKPLEPPPLPDSDSQLTEAQKESLRPEIEALIQASYLRALINANLLPESVGAPP